MHQIKFSRSITIKALAENSPIITRVPEHHSTGTGSHDVQYKYIVLCSTRTLRSQESVSRDWVVAMYLFVCVEAMSQTFLQRQGAYIQQRVKKKKKEKENRLSHVPGRSTAYYFESRTNREQHEPPPPPLPNVSPYRKSTKKYQNFKNVSIGAQKKKKG